MRTFVRRIVRWISISINLYFAALKCYQCMNIEASLLWLEFDDINPECEDPGISSSLDKETCETGESCVGITGTMTSSMLY